MVRVLLGVIGMLVIFYTVPVSTDDSTGRAVVSILFTLGGVAALAWAILAAGQTTAAQQV